MSGRRRGQLVIVLALAVALIGAWHLATRDPAASAAARVERVIGIPTGLNLVDRRTGDAVLSEGGVSIRKGRFLARGVGSGIVETLGPTNSLVPYDAVRAALMRSMDRLIMGTRESLDPPNEPARFSTISGKNSRYDVTAMISLARNEPTDSIDRSLVTRVQITIIAFR